MNTLKKHNKEHRRNLTNISLLNGCRNKPKGLLNDTTPIITNEKTNEKKNEETNKNPIPKPLEKEIDNLIETPKTKELQYITPLTSTQQPLTNDVCNCCRITNIYNSGGGGTGTFIELSSNTNFSFTGTTYFIIPSMTYTVTKTGLYYFIFSANISISQINQSVSFGLFNNNVLIANSSRIINGTNNIVQNVFFSVGTQAIIALNINDVLTVQIKSNGIGTTTVGNRSLVFNLLNTLI